MRTQGIVHVQCLVRVQWTSTMSISLISLWSVFWASSTYSHRVIVRTEKDNILKSTYLACSSCTPTGRRYYCSTSLQWLILPPDAISSVLTLWVELFLKPAELGDGVPHWFCAAYKDMSPLGPQCCLCYRLICGLDFSIWFDFSIV